MKLHEKLQYKLRNYVYEQQRKKIVQPKGSPKKSSHHKDEAERKGKLLGAIDEMDSYIGEKIKGINIPKLNKHE